MTKEFNLFDSIDLTEDDFLDISEAKNAEFGGLFDTEEPVAVVEPKDEKKDEELPVVQVTTDANSKSKEKKSTKKKADPALAKNIKEQMKKKEEQKVDATWEVAYAGHRINPPHEMQVEELRAWLELDFPELSKERCRMIVEEKKKLIVPVVSGAKNG